MNQILKKNSTHTDLKNRFGGVLENPYISKIQRHSLDGFKVRGLAQILKPYQFKNILDIGCGFGEYVHLNKGHYHGVDNSFPRVSFAQRKYSAARFIHGSVITLPFKDNSFEAVLLANTIHHLSDGELKAGLDEMKRVSRKYLIIDDAVKWPTQSSLSHFFYRLDRGTMFRTADQLKNSLGKLSQARIILESEHKTFPGLYLHSVFVLELQK